MFFSNFLRGWIGLGLFIAALFFSTLSVVSEAKAIPGGFDIRQNPYRYSEYYLDTESALCYCQARYYSSDLMRFINRDTYDVANRYNYCDDSPIENFDPNGHMKLPKGFPEKTSFFLSRTSGELEEYTHVMLDR